MKKNIIFITGSTCSGVGKGVVLASIGKLLEVLGFSIKIIKVDPYLNQDAGTMNPQEHGEVWVTKSGKETDTDGGTYFRFLNMDEDNTVLLTAGNILQSVFQKERSGAYQGETVRINPHMVNEIKNIIINDNNAQFTLVEIGGTVGETELIPFISTIKNMQHDESLNIMHINLALTITLPATNEVKIKPVEMFYNMLPYGINIDMQILRTTRPLNEKEIKKIKSYSYVKNIVGLEKASSIYEIPMMLQKQNVHEMIMDHFGVVSLKRNIQLEDFNNILNIKNNKSAKLLL
jgi:CTP synthase